MQAILFWIFATITCGSAIAVAVSQNVVRMALWLILALGSVSGLFFMLNADFVGATQLLIYVGGTLVVLIFGVMLTATGPWRKTMTSPAEGFLAAGVGLIFLTLLMATTLSVNWDQVVGERVAAKAGYNPVAVGNTARPLGLSFLGLRPDKDLDSAVTPIALRETQAVVAEPSSIQDAEDEKKVVDRLETTFALPTEPLEAGARYRVDLTYGATTVPMTGAFTVDIAADGYDAPETAPISDSAKSLKEPQAGYFYFTLAEQPQELKLVARVEKQRSKTAGSKLIPEGDDAGPASELTIENVKLSKVGRLSTGYLLPFEIISVHLLVVLIGAAYLARAKRSQHSTEEV